MTDENSGGNEIYANQAHFTDSHIVVRLLGFDSSNGIARLAVDENHDKVGFYYITVNFGSGDSTRIAYDGGNPYRDGRPTVGTSHRNDVLTGIAVKRVGD